MAELRIRKELQDFENDSALSGVNVKLVGEKFNHLTGTIVGPTESPYEGGLFRVEIHIPTSYPFEPPKIHFTTKVWHPNISSQTGVICLDILKDQWSPALTLKTALISIQALLTAAEPDDPQDGVVAEQYKSNYDEFVSTAKFWTESYAMRTPSGGPVRGGIVDERVSNLIAMGFSEAAATKALEESKGNVQVAANSLLTG